MCFAEGRAREQKWGIVILFNDMTFPETNTNAVRVNPGLPLGGGHSAPYFTTEPSASFRVPWKHHILRVFSVRRSILRCFLSFSCMVLQILHWPANGHLCVGE